MSHLPSADRIRQIDWNAGYEAVEDALPLNPYMPLEQFLSRGLALTRHDLLDAQRETKFFYGPTEPTALFDWLAGAGAHYDDEEGRYMCGPRDHVAFRYEIVRQLGAGAFGRVFLALDHKYSRQVALKIVNILEDPEDQVKSEFEAFAIYTLNREHRRTHGLRKDRIIKLLHALKFRGHICIALELLSGDLQAELDLTPHGFALEKVRDLTLAIVQAIQVLHALHMIHGDIKLDNIIRVSADSDAIKLVDFGLSSFEVAEDTPHELVGCLCCRAPEVVLGSGFGRPVDMWALGCIVAEMYTGTALFYAANSAELIMFQAELLGLPSMRMLIQSRYTSRFFNCDLSQCCPRAVRHPPGSKSITQMLGPDADADLVQFVTECLNLDPARRLTADAALRHPFLRKAQAYVQDEAEEPVQLHLHVADGSPSPSIASIKYPMQSYIFTIKLPAPAAQDTPASQKTARSRSKTVTHPAPINMPLSSMRIPSDPLSSSLVAAHRARAGGRLPTVCEASGTFMEQSVSQGSWMDVSVTNDLAAENKPPPLRLSDSSTTTSLPLSKNPSHSHSKMGRASPQLDMSERHSASPTLPHVSLVTVPIGDQSTQGSNVQKPSTAQPAPTIPRNNLPPDQCRAPTSRSQVSDV